MHNEASCDLLDALTGESGAIYETGRPTNPTRSDDVGFASGDVGHATRSTANELMNRRRPRASRTLNPRILDTL